jgi:GT2 family glycosyltransferase
VTVLPVSVIIATCNRARLLADTVHSICEGSALPAHLVVVDQSDAPEIAAGWCIPAGVQVEHRSVAWRGLSRARNLGARLARFPILVFLDDDMRADHQWLSALAAPLLRDPGSIVVTGRVTAGAAESDGGFVPAVVDRTTEASYAGRLPIDVLAGGNMALARATFLQIGGFDESLGPGTSFPAAEDNDLGFRLLDAGLRIVYVPDAILEHRAWRSRDHFLSLRFDYGCGKGAFYLKHVRRDDLHTLRRATRDLARRAWRTVRFAHHPRLAAGELAYAAGVLTGAGQWMLRPHPASSNHED